MKRYPLLPGISVRRAARPAAVVSGVLAAAGLLAVGAILSASHQVMRALHALVPAVGDPRASMDGWLAQMRSQGPLVRTERVGCREYESGAQSCVFEGLVCIDVLRTKPREQDSNPTVFIVDDARVDGADVPSDEWCKYRYQSAGTEWLDPRYFGPRHWPMRTGTFAPQWSCMRGKYRTFASISDYNSSLIKWLPAMSLVNLDYSANSHNNHLLKDIVWLLDTVLWQRSLDNRPSPAFEQDGRREEPALFEMTADHIFLPQSYLEFERQTGRDVNRLLYGLVLEANLSQLYPNSTRMERETPMKGRETVPLAKAFPEWFRRERLLFYGDLYANSEVQLVCTSRLAVGSKIGNGGHERVCRSLRERGWDLFGIPPLPMKRVGQIYYNQPPRRLVILQRHQSRGFGNLDETVQALRKHFSGANAIEIEIVSTDVLRTAEDFVRVFSRAGALLTPHGSQSMGQIWMPRHSALIEVMPVGYTDYAFSLLADSCKLWYYEVPSLRDPAKSAAYYEEKCGTKVPHVLNPCNDMKTQPVFVPILEAIRVLTTAFERMGHSVGEWPPGASVDEELDLNAGMSVVNKSRGTMKK